MAIKNTNDLVWRELGEQLNLEEIVIDYLIAKQHRADEKSKAQAGVTLDLSPHSRFNALLRHTFDTPDQLIQLTAQAEIALDRFLRETIHGMPQEQLASYFADDHYLCGEWRQALLSPNNGEIAVPRQFEFAMHRASHAARPLIATALYGSNVHLHMLGIVAAKTDGAVFRDNYRDCDFMTLNAMKRLHKQLGIQADMLYPRHKGFAALLGAGSLRAKAAFDKIIEDAYRHISSANLMHAKQGSAVMRSPT